MQLEGNAGEREEKLSRALSYLRHRAEEQGFEIIKTNAAELDGMTVGSSHGGVAALCSGRTVNDVTPDDVRPDGFYVYIEGIEDPYNFGYALRSLYAAGVDGVILPERNWLSAAGVVCRSSAGASELCTLYTYTDDTCGIFKKAGYRVLCADTENAVSVYDTDCRKPLLLVVGEFEEDVGEAAVLVAEVADFAVCLGGGFGLVVEIGRGVLVCCRPGDKN